MYPKSDPLGLTSAVLFSILVGFVFTGCTTGSRSVSGRTFPKGASDKLDLAELVAGAIVITPRNNDAQISADPPNRQIEPIAEGAANATRSFLNTPNLGNPQLEAGVGAVQFALAPLAAAYGAINASQKRLSPDEAYQSQVDLTQTMRSIATPEVLVENVAKIAQQKTRRLLICASCDSNSLPSQVPLSARLEISISQLRLKAVKSGGNHYFLSVGASARLIRAADGKVLLQKAYLYESGSDSYIDWTRNRGLEDVASTGYQVLAGQIADDIFQPISQAPMLIGPGQKHSRESSRQIPGPVVGRDSSARKLTSISFERHGRKTVGHLLLTARRHGTTHDPLKIRSLRVRQLGSTDSTAKVTPVQFVSPLQVETRPMEIHTGKMDDRIRLPAQGPESSSSSGGMSDTKWSLDGMEYDRNAVVQGVACLATVPFGLWEQTFGILHQHSLERMEELCRTLNTVTTYQHLEADLADEVAQRLKSAVADPVRRTDEPMRIALAGMTSKERATDRNGPADNKTALEIQVVSTRLVGKHRNSTSRSMVVDVQATVFRTSDGQELYSRPIRYTSSSKKLKNWAASNERLFRRELVECSRQTAEALVNDLLSQGLVTPIQPVGSAFRLQEK